MVKILIRESALKHGITESQIMELLADELMTKSFDIHEDAEGNPQEMLVGFTQANVMLEIAVRYTDRNDEVFHANRVSTQYRKLYEGGEL